MLVELNMGMSTGEIMSGRNRCILRKSHSKVTLSTTNPTRTSLVSIPGPRADKPVTDSLKFLFICVSISFRHRNASLFIDRASEPRHHFRNDGSHGICGGESGTELNLIALVLALVFLIFFFHPS